MVRVGIRREDKNVWERRVPLTPDHVAELIEDHSLKLSVQPSPIRAFPNKDYLAAGAGIEKELTGCGVILGVKEIPIELLDARKTYAFFSHTTKGQAYNMPLLGRILELGSTLVDYEHIRDERGRRLVVFGRFAGYAGMIDALWALGRRLAVEGIPTPFERIRLAHDYSSLDEAASHISRVGEVLRHTGVPGLLRPTVFAFTGSGNVVRGAQEIFDRLPHVELHPDELERFANDPERPRNVLYRVNFNREQRIARIGGGAVDLEELAQHPELYESAIPRVLEHLSVIVHGAFWEPSQPRLLSLADLESHWGNHARPKLRLIADISCDVRGGIEATRHVTTPDDPVFVYDLERGEPVAGVRGNGPVVLAIDNLPCQLPIESSQHFGDTLLQFVPPLARCEWSRPFGELSLPPEIANAVVAHAGELTPRFSYLRQHLSSAEAGQ